MSLEPHQIIIGSLIACFLLGWLVIRVLAQQLDRKRVEYFVNGYGNKLLEIKWAPFGPWAFGEKSRVYLIRYLDPEGREHQAYAKTSLLNGVFFSEDRIIQTSSPDSSISTSPANK